MRFVNLKITFASEIALQYFLAFVRAKLDKNYYVRSQSHAHLKHKLRAMQLSNIV